jgi:hypothetical protein
MVISTSHSLSRHKTKRHLRKTSGITQFFKEKLTDKEQIFYFMLGIFSAWRPEAEIIYKKASEIISIAKSCIDVIEPLFKKDVEKPEAIITIEGSWEKSTEDKKESFCKKTKDEMELNYADPASAHKSGIRERIISQLVNKLFGWDHCEVKYENKKKQLATKYGTYENYQNECRFFRSLDCSKFKVSNDVITIIKKAYNFYDFAKNGIECLSGLKDLIVVIIPEFAQTFEGSVVQWVSSVVSSVHYDGAIF